jgi:SAM-dependent methyltransferase
MKNKFFYITNILRFISQVLGFFSRQMDKYSNLISQYINNAKYDPAFEKNKYISLTHNNAMTEFFRNKKKFKKLMDQKLKENKVRIEHSFLIKTHHEREWEFYTSYYNAELKDTDMVLDTGAYNTYFCVFLKDYVKKIYSTDSFYWAERNHVKELNLPLPGQWMDKINGIEPAKLAAREEDLTNLSFENDKFDKIFCISVIEHVKDDLVGMKEMFRVLRPGGILLLTTEVNKRLNKPYSEVDKSYYRVYSYEQIIDLIKRVGFKLVGEDRVMETMNRDSEFNQVLFVLTK